MLGYLMIFSNGEQKLHCQNSITTVPSLKALYEGVHNTRMVTLDLRKFSDVKQTTFRETMQ
jgi:hypothetical protein